MTAAVSVSIPGGPVLSQWWSLLRAAHPCALWLQHLILHRLDASFQCLSARPLDALEKLLLETLHQQRMAAVPFDAQLLFRVMNGLGHLGLATPTATGWAITDAGKEALHSGLCSAPCEQRRTLYFLAGTAPGVPPRYLPLHQPRTLPSQTAASWEFNLGVVQDHLAQSPEWKTRHGFPHDLVSLLFPEEQRARLATWRRIAVAHVEQALFLQVLLHTPEGKEELRGYSVQPPQWDLNLDHPNLVLGSNWRELLPELAAEIPLEQWHHVWRHWGQSQGLGAADLEACHLQHAGTVLRVTSPEEVAARLRREGTPTMQETWLMAGSDPLREMARVEIVAPSP